MKIFCDHEELIEQLKGERDSLRLLNAEQSAMIQNLQAGVKALQEAFTRATNALREASATPKPQPLTREALARQARIPESLIDQVDWQRMGIQVER